MREYYVYIYLDPRKPGVYDYNGIKFEYEPFYIGKGKRLRLFVHVFKNDNYNKIKTSLIKKLLNLKLDPIIIKYKEDLLESEAFEIEVDLINKIGRRNTKTGPLTNLTLGGTGGDTYSFKSEEEKALIREKRSNSMKGKNTRPRTTKEKEHLRQLNLGKKYPEHSERMRGRKLSDVTKEKINKKREDWYSNNKSKKRKKVIQKSLTGEVIKIWDCISETKTIGGISGVNDVLRGKRKTAGGYKWERYE